MTRLTLMTRLTASSYYPRVMSPETGLGHGATSNMNPATRVLHAPEIGVGRGAAKGFMDRPLRFGKGEACGQSTKSAKTKDDAAGHIPGHIAAMTIRPTEALHI